jgi:tetratricopeptide (TPR) repeat protein
MMIGSNSKSSLKTNLVLAIGSLAIVFLWFAMFEGVLRVVGVGGPDASRTSRLKYQQIFLPILETGTRPDRTGVYHTVDPRLPYQAILREKPKKAFRIFILGGSAAAGLGYSPNASFSRHLERMLRTAYPNRKIEVVNLGIVALSSKQVKLLVEDVSKRFEPDLVIIYSGNNEFLEIHAEKYAQAHATVLSNVVGLLGKTNLYRFLTRIVHGGPTNPSIVNQDFSHNDLRITQDRIIKDIELSKGEIAGVIDKYEANLDNMVRVAVEHSTSIMLLSVASNLKWRGRSDLPEDWIEKLIGSEDLPAVERYNEVVRYLDEKLRHKTDPDRHEWLFRRSVANENLGNFKAARDDYRKAMNADPHLRRALDEMNARVRAVAERHGVPWLDTVEVLAARAEHGIIGFGEFYDYVHFTPIGAVYVAAEVFRKLGRLGFVPPSVLLDPEEYVRKVSAKLEHLSEDFIAVHEWLGIAFDRARIHDRDLWKYDQMLADLNEILSQEPTNVLALIYRGNASFFQVDGAAQAAHDYRTALELAGNIPEVKANLEALLRERVP